jgi:hypothetical protein
MKSSIGVPLAQLETPDFPGLLIGKNHFERSFGRKWWGWKSGK